ncbi:hypothetical protein [Streptomyces pactum]|uniref:hypothetical protein n=1 Tax=Streptomyces pactum TaxID=68249 RepID=UPI003702286C
MRHRLLSLALLCLLPGAAGCVTVTGDGSPGPRPAGQSAPRSTARATDPAHSPGRTPAAPATGEAGRAPGDRGGPAREPAPDRSPAAGPAPAAPTAPRVPPTAAGPAPRLPRGVLPEGMSMRRLCDLAGSRLSPEQLRVCRQLDGS